MKAPMVAEIVTAFESNWSKDWTDERRVFWTKQLAPLSEEPAVDAAQACMQSAKWLPSWAEFYEAYRQAAFRRRDAAQRHVGPATEVIRRDVGAWWSDRVRRYQDGELSVRHEHSMDELDVLGRGVCPGCVADLAARDAAFPDLPAKAKGR